jgi:hypothetical protein
MVELLEETRITLTELAKREGVNVATTFRWANRGCRGIRLETFLLGGRRFTTVEAFSRFVAQTTATVNATALPAYTAKAREAEIAAAERELAAVGI